MCVEPLRSCPRPGGLMLAGRRCWSFEDVRVSSPIARSTPSPQPVSLACDTLPGPVSECPRHWCGGGGCPAGRPWCHPLPKVGFSKPTFWRGGPGTPLLTAGGGTRDPGGPASMLAKGSTAAEPARGPSASRWGGDPGATGLSAGSGKPLGSGVGSWAPRSGQGRDEKDMRPCRQ